MGHRYNLPAVTKPYEGEASPLPINGNLGYHDEYLDPTLCDSTSLGSSSPKVQINIEKLLHLCFPDFKLSYMEGNEIKTVASPTFDDAVNRARCYRESMSYSDVSYCESDSCPSSAIGDEGSFISDVGEESYAAVSRNLIEPSSYGSSCSTEEPSRGSANAFVEPQELDLGLKYQHHNMRAIPAPEPESPVVHLQKQAEEPLKIRQLINRYLVPLFLEWNMDLRKDSVLREAISAAFLRITEQPAGCVKKVAAGTMNFLYPRRRSVYPYKNKIIPANQWPSTVPYKDPGHLTSSERWAVLIWLYCNPNHSWDQLTTSHSKLMVPTKDVSAALLKIALDLRNVLRAH